MYCGRITDHEMGRKGRKCPIERGGFIIDAKKQLALAALLSSPTKEAAARKAGINGKTLRRYLQDEEFSTAYKQAAAEMVEDATRQLQQSLSSAVTRLRMIVSSNQEATANQITAARTLLEYSLKFCEFNDILKQLNELEQWRDKVDGND